ncbi:MAG: competence/damage-inducible protein A [Chitinophagaceae bacterium]
MKEVNASIITIGDELLIGQTIDTNSAFIAKELNKIGIWIKRKLAVADTKEEILSALDLQSKDSDIVIITGGLGPTADDITKPALCEFFKSELIINEGALENVKNIFKQLGRLVTDRNTKQAEVLSNCKVLENKRGTAPGMWFNHNDMIYVSLPGVPHEMKGVMVDAVIPEIRKTFALPAVVHKTLLTAGIGESDLADKLQDFEDSLPLHIKLAYLPSYGMVRLRLTAKNNDVHDLEPEVLEHFTTLKTITREWLVIDEDLSIQEAIFILLNERGKTLSTAESCTGGYIAHLITSIAGSSKIFNGSIISYANDVKTNLLKVDEKTLKEVGAVSEETVLEMLKGLLSQFNTDYGLATSGIMGPTGGSEEKPVGTVWIAVGKKGNMKAKKFKFRFDRKRNIELTAFAALNMLRKWILEEEAG